LAIDEISMFYQCFSACNAFKNDVQNMIVVTFSDN